MSNSKKLQVRIDDYAYGVWFDTVDFDPYKQTVTIVDGFGKEMEIKVDGSFKCREVEGKGMREIKFRAKTATTNRWVYGHYAFKEGYHVIYEGGEPFVIVGSTLGQYTSLKDAKGVEIYEGDVLTSNVQPCKMVNPIKDGYGVVRFENGMFKLGAISLVTFISKMEVIGNIYENPELLEREAE